MRWVEEAGESLPDEPQDDEIPEITEIDELYAERYPLGQTFVGSKKNRFWIWTVVNHRKKGIILWNLGDCGCGASPKDSASRRHRSHESFEPIWQIIKCWHSFFYLVCINPLSAIEFSMTRYMNKNLLS